MRALEYLAYKHGFPKAAGRTRASPMGILNHGSFLNGVRIWLAFRIIRLWSKAFPGCNCVITRAVVRYK